MKRIRINKQVRYGILAVLAVMLLFSVSNFIAAYDIPEETEESYVALSYSQTGRYYYNATFLDNTVYNKTVLGPGQGLIFRNILISLNPRFSYSFSLDDSGVISGEYKIVAKIETDIWTKTYLLVPTTSFSESGRRFDFTESFPLDYFFYEEVLNTINRETDMTAPNPQLVVTCDLDVAAQTDEYDVSETFTQSLSFSLNEKIIEPSETLAASKTGSIRESKTVYHPEVLEQRQTALTWFILVDILMLVTFFVTEGQKVRVDAVEKLLENVNKKYGEWTVPVDKRPSLSGLLVVDVLSLEDLSKVSIDTARPMLSFSATKTVREYYVLDGDQAYRHILDSQKEIAKSQNVFEKLRSLFK